MITRSQISGLILTGGQGRRLQDGDSPRVEKGLVSLHGKPLVARMQEFMAPGVSEIFISANHQLDAYARYGIVVADDPSLGDSQGPLAGIASVLPKVNTPWLFVMPVDIPYPPKGLLESLLKHAGTGTGNIYYVAAERNHPLCMLLQCGLAADLRRYLALGGRRVQDWHQREAAIPVVFQGHPGSFHNINTPEDLHLAQQLGSGVHP